MRKPEDSAPAEVAAAAPLLSLPEDILVSQSGFLFDPVSGLTCTLNRTAVFLFHQIQSGASLAEVVAALTEHFEVPPEVAEADVRDFVQQLRDLGLG